MGYNMYQVVLSQKFSFLGSVEGEVLRLERWFEHDAWDKQRNTDSQILLPQNILYHQASNPLVAE